MAGKSGQTIGFSYILTVLAGLGRGPIDELVEISADSKQAWVGSATDDTPQAVNKPNLFGGDEKEGGLQGAFRLFQGGADQVLPGATTVGVAIPLTPPTYDGAFALVDYSFASLGPYPTAEIPDIKAAIGTAMSELRGVATVLWRGMVCSMSPYPKEWKYRQRKTVSGWPNDECWYPAKAAIWLDGDGGYTDTSFNYITKIKAMNPAHIIYLALIEPEWGAAYSPDDLDENSFILAANTLCSEGFGLCLTWTRQEEVLQFLQVVMDHIGAVLYTDRGTGKTVLKLIRADYDPADVPLYTPTTGLLSIDDDDSSAGDEAINEVTVKGHDPVNNTDFEVRDHNISAWQATGEMVPHELNLPGIPTRALALRIAARELASSGPGLKKFNLVIDRRAWRVGMGSVIRISSPANGIDNMIVRIGQGDFGSSTDGSIKFKAVEDVYGLPESGFMVPVASTWTPDDTRALAPTETRLIEAGYRDALMRLSDTGSDRIEPTDAYIGQLAVAPSSAALQYDLASKADGDADYALLRSAGAFTGTALVAADVLPLDTTIAFESAASFNEANVNQALLITDGTAFEIVHVTGFSSGSITVARGCADTVPQAHPAGARIWTIDDDLVSDQRVYVTGEDVTTVVLTRTSRDVLALADATPETLTMVSRQDLPYPPGNVQIGGQSVYVAGLHTAPVLTWTHRDRLTQGDRIVAHGEASVGPEVGVTYTIRLYDFSDGTTLLREVTGLTGTTWTYDSTMQTADGSPDKVIAHLLSVRDGLESWQHYEFVVRINGGYGLDYGLNYGGA